MTTRTILSRSGRIAMLMAGAILLTLTGAASAKSSGGQSQAAPSKVASKPANSLLKVIPVKKPADMRPSSDSPPMTPGSGGMKSTGNGTEMSSGHQLPYLPRTPGGSMDSRSGNGLPSLPTTRSGDMRSSAGSDRPPATGTRGPVRVLEY